MLLFFSYVVIRSRINKFHPQKKRYITENTAGRNNDKNIEKVYFFTWLRKCEIRDHGKNIDKEGDNGRKKTIWFFHSCTQYLRVPF